MKNNNFELVLERLDKGGTYEFSPRFKIMIKFDTDVGPTDFMEIKIETFQDIYALVGKEKFFKEFGPKFAELFNKGSK